MYTEEFTTETGLEYIRYISTPRKKESTRRQAARSKKKEAEDWDELVKLVQGNQRKYCENKREFLKFTMAYFDEILPRPENLNRDQERERVRKLVRKGEPCSMTYRELRVYAQLRECDKKRRAK